MLFSHKWIIHKIKINFFERIICLDPNCLGKKFLYHPVPYKEDDNRFTNNTFEYFVILQV